MNGIALMRFVGGETNLRRLPFAFGLYAVCGLNNG